MKTTLILSLLLSGSLMAQSPKKIIAKFKSGVNPQELKIDGKVKKLFSNVYVITSNKTEELKKSLKDVTVYIEDNARTKERKLPTIEPISLEELKGNSSNFNDPLANKVWAFNDASSNGVSVEKAYTAYPNNTTTEVIVAVVDTGVDYNHEDLKNVMWVNKGEIAGNGIDDDQNGYVDDVHGIDTLDRDADGNATGDMMDTHSHGTHVSGTIAAQQNNGKGIAGIASNVKIMGIRTVPNRGDETDVDVVESFIYAAKNGAKIINCSFGKDHNEGGMAVKEAIDFIGKEYGTLVIAAAGNSSRNIDSRPTWPASYESENLLVVASTTSRGSMSYFSNYGTKSVDIAAPGSSVYSTTPRNRYGSMSGTSMASPTTAGVAAEVLSHYPNLSPVELKAVLMNNTTKSRSYSRTSSGGRVDLYNSLKSLE
ncbi:MAG: S8 family serine peptidase [Oligoflexia bacterium]|nr:S8 family serine peptidase [Oligoflexia bacterium]